jgi:hypothetical protein
VQAGLRRLGRPVRAAHGAMGSATFGPRLARGRARVGCRRPQASL